MIHGLNASVIEPTEIESDDSAAPVEYGRTSRPLRIALFSYRSDPHVGGQGIFASSIAAALARRGHRVTIVSGPPYPNVPAGVELTQLPSLDLFAQPQLGRYALRWRHLKSWTDTAEYFGHVSGKFMEPWSFGRRAARWAKDNAHRFDAMIDNQTLAWGMLDIAKRVPLLTVHHHPIRRDLEFALAGEADKGKQWLLRRWYSFVPMQEEVARKLPRLVSVSTASAKDIAQCSGADLDRIGVIPLGVDQSVFRPGVAPRAPLRIVTTASADVPLKGLRYLLTAHAALLKTWPELELVIVGRPRPGPTTELIDTLNTRHAIRFVHDLSTAQMAETYASATLCVTPSLYEGFGLPAVEAMACATPVVVTDGGALPEVVGDAGVVVPAGDAQALEQAIAQLLSDPAALARMGAAGLQRVRARYGWDRVGEAYERELYAMIDRTC